MEEALQVVMHINQQLDLVIILQPSDVALALPLMTIVKLHVIQQEHGIVVESIQEVHLSYVVKQIQYVAIQ